MRIGWKRAVASFVAAIALTSISSHHVAHAQTAAPLPAPSVKPITIQNNWSSYAAAAQKGMQQAVNMWVAAASMGGIVVNGPSATGGQLIGPPLQPQIQAVMLAAKVPLDIANAVASTLSTLWANWESSVTQVSLTAGLRAALTAHAKDIGEDAAITQLAKNLAAQFTTFCGFSQMTVMGQGRVPTYAPPFGPPAGPVVSGCAQMLPGALVGTWPTM